ncbi:SPAG5 protein, partial [Oxyruncus cristatus]|nr:SPAG5 protein [Oxyruncus cristatus]
SAGPLPCQGTPEGAESSAPAPPGQSPPGLASIGASVLEPAGSEATIAPVTSPELASGAVSWMLPLVWLEKTLNVPSLMESLRHSLSLHMPQQDANCSITPVASVVASTSTTPVASVVASTSTTPVASVVASTSTTPVASVVASTSTTPVASYEDISLGLWHLWAVPALSPLSVPSCPREQLKTLPRAELEGRLESTLIIIEALALQLRGWQESQRLLPGVGPAEQRDTITQTDITHPEGEEEIYHHLYLEQWKKTAVLQRQQGAEQDLQQELELAAKNLVAWSSQCLLFRGLADAAFQRLKDEQGALAQEREQVRALVSRCQAMLERVPSKLQSCLEERDAKRQRADE